jgi:protein-S-isoprenylcysteine O-methyltransferase Ste14
MNERDRQAERVEESRAFPKVGDHRVLGALAEILRTDPERVVAMSLWLRNLLFTVVVPGAGGVLIPWWILSHAHAAPDPAAWYAAAVIVLGATLYFWCLWAFASVGTGTPGPWDPPRRFVAAGPYRCVRNPMYISALCVVVGEAWLFRSVPLLAYAVAAALFFQLFVIGYEEPTLRRRFGEPYADYRRTVPHAAL